VLPAGHTSVSLAPPSPPNKRTGVRRTSISNIVQRYEGIVKSTGSGGSPSAKLSRAATTRVGSSLMAEDGRYTQGQRQKDQAGLTPSDASYSWRSNSPTKDAGLSPDTLRVLRSPPSIIHKGLDESVPRTPKLSFNREASRPVFSSSSKPAEDSPSRPGDERSSSPERPYQGVGKLIDQWQRKTAEASSTTRSPIGRGRGTFVAARGIAQSIPGESQ
jgi:AP2-associated kinase